MPVMGPLSLNRLCQGEEERTCSVNTVFSDEGAAIAAMPPHIAALMPSEMMRRRRLGNLRRLFRDRYGYQFPDDDAGREDLYELLLPISVGRHADIKMPHEIELWAPWMAPDEANELIDRIDRTPMRWRKPKAELLGKRLRLTNDERERLKLWTIRPHDMNKRQILAQRKAKATDRMRRLRQAHGSKPHAEFISKAKPWLFENPPISRRTYYRRLAKRRGTTSCAVRLSNTEHESVPPEQTSKPRKRLSETNHVSRHRTPTKAEKPKTKKRTRLTP